MYNFSANIGGKILPLMYTLLPSKSEIIYLKLFKMFQEMQNFEPKDITVDFELAVTNALLKIWPNIIINYCWFHYSQSLWRNIQLKNLAKDYLKDPMVRTLFKYFKFLPFIPPADVVKAFKQIKSYAN